MCVPSGRGTFIRKRATADKRSPSGLGDRVDAAPAAAADAAPVVSAPSAGGGSAAPAAGGGGRRSGTMRFVSPGTENLQYGPMGGDVIRGESAPSAPVVAPRPGGDVVTTQGRTRKKRGDILRSGILTTVRSAGAGGTPSLFAPSADSGSKEKLGQ